MTVRKEGATGLLVMVMTKHEVFEVIRELQKIVQIISIPPKPPNSPITPENWCIRRCGWPGNCTDASTMRTDVQSVATAENASRNIRRDQKRPRRPDSPYRLETETAKCPRRWTVTP